MWWSYLCCWWILFGSIFPKQNDGNNNAENSKRNHYINETPYPSHENKNFNYDTDQNKIKNKYEVNNSNKNKNENDNKNKNENDNENENENENEEEIFHIPLHDVIGGMDQERNAAEKFVRTLSHALKSESKSPVKNTNLINTDLINTDLKNTILKNESLEKFELECKIKVSERKNGKKNSFSEFLSNCAEEKNKFEFLLSLFSNKKT